MTTNTITRAAQDLYLNDAQFHALVETVVLAIDSDLRAEKGVGLDPSDRSLATLAASCALAAARRMT